MDVLTRRFDIHGGALGWIQNYLSGRSQVVHASRSESGGMTLKYGVPRGSVLGPRIFIEYAEDVSDIFAFHGLRHHLFADDMQGYCSGRLDDVHVMHGFEN